MARLRRCLNSRLVAISTLVIALSLTIFLTRHLNGKMGQLLLNAPPLLAVSSYAKNPHTRQIVRTEKNAFWFDYTFRDYKGRDWNWRWAYEKTQTLRDIARFGLPLPLRQSEFGKTLEPAMVRFDQNTISPDYQGLIGTYKVYGSPLFDLARQSSGNGRPHDIAQIVLSFMQDIPYGIPPDDINGRRTLGLLTPPQTFLEGWGDCDTKSLLLAAILANDPSIEVILVLVPQHMFIGISGVPKPYQKFLTYHGKRFILGEAAGPGRFPLGQLGKNYSTINRIELAVARERPASGSPVVTQATRLARIFAGRGATVLSERLNGDVLEVDLQSEPDRRMMAKLERQGQSLEDHQTTTEKLPSGPQSSRYKVRTKLNGPGEYTLSIFIESQSRPNYYDQVLAIPVSK